MVSTHVSAFLNGLRLGFSEFEVKVLERLPCAESNNSILLSHF